VSAAVKRIELVSDRLPYIVLKVRWCNFIVCNVHVPSEERRNDLIDRFYEKLEQVFYNFPKYRMKIPLGDFNAKVGKENVFKPTTGSSLHRDSNNNVVRIVNFATSKILIVKSMMFPHRNIHKYTWTSPDGKTNYHIDHILIDMRWHSCVLYV